MTTAPAPAEQPSQKWLIYGGLLGCGTVAFLGFVTAVAIVVWLALRPTPPVPTPQAQPVPASQPQPPPQPAPQPEQEGARFDIIAIGGGDGQGNLVERTDTLSTQEREIVAQVAFRKFSGVTAKLAAVWARAKGNELPVIILADPVEFDLTDQLSGQTMTFWLRADGFTPGQYRFAIVQVLPGGKYRPLAQRPFKVE